jgi:hypothetical protein
MSTTIKTGWLNDKQGNKFAPKTLMSQVQTGDGILLEDKIKADLDNVAENISINTLANAKDYTDAEITEWVGDKTVSEQISAAIANKSDVGHTHAYIPTSEKGAKSGVAELDENGKVLSSQLPSYVDDVVEAASPSAFPTTGEAGKIYIAVDTNKTYRWSGSAYTEISASLALGETSSTAYRGDRGAIAYSHSQVTTGNPHGTTKSDLGLGNVENKSSATIRGELTGDNVTTALGYSPASKNVATTGTDGLMSATDKTALNNLVGLVGDKKVSEQITTAIASKSDVGHTHTIENVDGLGSTLEETRTYIDEVNSKKTDLSESEVDNTINYIKDIPDTSAPYARINTIGGMTRKCTNLCGSFSFITGYTTALVTENISVKANTDYTVQFFGDTNINVVYVALANGTNAVHVPDVTSGYTATFNTGNNTELFLQINTKTAVTDLSIYKAMLNEGTEPLPYEPYFEGLRSAPVTEVESVGVNLLPIGHRTCTSEGITYVVNADGSVTVNGTATANSYLSFEKSFKLSKGLYTYSGYPDGGSESTYTLQLYRVNEDGSTGAVFLSTYSSLNSIFEVKQDMFLRGYIAVREGVTINNLTYYPMINKGTTALPYTPYQRNTLPIPAEVQALDGYGWGVNADCYNYIDWEKKQFVKRVGCVDLGTLTWNYESLHPRFNASIPNLACVTTRADIILSSKFSTDLTADKGDNWKGFSYLSFVYVYTTEYTDVATFKAAMSGVMLYYELAEPVITDISDILPDDNLIGVEGGGTVTMVNEYGYDVPSEVVYYLNNNDKISANEFIGNLKGTAVKAEYATKAIQDGDGNTITSTYETKSDASLKLSEAKTYTDEQIGAMVGDESVSEQISEAIDGVTLSSLGVTATATELNKLDGVTATTAELNYVDGVTSNVQTQLDGKVPTSRTVNGKALSSNISLTASDVGAAASSHTHNYLPLSGGNLSGTLGINQKYELGAFYNYTSGYLIDIGSAKGSTMVAIHVTGNSYNTSTAPIDSLFQFYDYGDGTIMNYSGINLGLSLGNMTVYRYNNRLYAHIKQTASYQTLSFTLLTNKSGLSPTVSHSAAHTSGYTDLITITPANNITSSNIGSQSVNYATSAGSASSATKATQDASGNTITSTYATKNELNTVSNLVGDTAVSTQISNAIANKSDTGHTHSAYVNQNAFSNVTVGSTTISADSATDTLTLVAGSNITITPDATNDKITIAAKDTVYTHPTTSGNKHIPSGGSSGQILRWSADGTAVWGADNNTTYSDATQSAAGLMSADDKKKLDGIATGANNITVDSSLSSSSTNPVQNKAVNTAISNLNTLVGDTKVSTQISNAIASKSDTGHTHDDRYYTESEVNNLLSGKAASSHGNHVPATETANNAKFLRNDNTWQTVTPANIGAAASSHGTHVTYSTTAPVMDGTATAGSASTVARSDHKHPTDTSRASASDLDALQKLVGDKAVSEQISEAATKLRTYKDDISEVNITDTAQTGEIVLGTAATKGIVNNTSTSSYLASGANLPTCATLYNFIQITHETVSAVIPAGSYSVTVDLPTAATKNDIIIPATGTTSYYAELKGYSEDSGYASQITFYRAQGQSVNGEMGCNGYLTRLRVMKY